MTYCLITVASALNKETLEYCKTVRKLLVDKFKDLNVKVKGLVLKIEDVNSLSFGNFKGLIIAVATGGTEKMILKLHDKSRLPILLIATSLSNSLAASLEVSTALKKLHAVSKILYYDFWEQVNADEVFSNMKLLETYSSIINARIGLVGDPSPWLVASSVNLENLRDKFRIEFVKIELEELYAEYKKARIASHDRKAIEKLLSMSKKVDIKHSDLIKAYRLYKALKNLARKYRLDGLTIRCFDLVLEKGVTACLALSLLNSEGVIAGCEGDQQAVLTMLILSRISGEPCWMANPVRINKSSNELFLAHCTVPLKIVKFYKLNTHYETGLSVGIDGEISSKTAVTVARINEDVSKILLAKGVIVDSSMGYEKYCRTQVKVKIIGDVEKLLDKSFGNHLVMVLGDHEEQLKNFAEMFDIEIVEL